MPPINPKRRAKALLDILGPLWPDARPLLAYASHFQLLVAVILSAQCTDDQVNRLTPALFKRWPDPESLAGADPGELESLIRPAGFYRVKGAHLRAMAAILTARFGGTVPSGMDELTSLPGVGRKSANVIRSACFGLPGIIADTHFIRVLWRTGVAGSRDPGRIETEVTGFLPPESWTAFSHAVNRHGKYTCKARKPACPACPVLRFCLRRGLEGQEEALS